MLLHAKLNFPFWLVYNAEIILLLKTVHPATKASAIWLLIVLILCLIFCTCILLQHSHANSDHSAALLEAVYSMSFKCKEIPQIHSPPTLNWDCDGLCVLSTPPHQPACRRLSPLQDKRHFWISNDLTLDQTNISSSSSSSLHSQRELFNSSAAGVTLQDQTLHVSSYTWQCPEKSYFYLKTSTTSSLAVFHRFSTYFSFLLEPKNDRSTFYTGLFLTTLLIAAGLTTCLWCDMAAMSRSQIVWFKLHQGFILGPDLSVPVQYVGSFPFGLFHFYFLPCYVCVIPFVSSLFSLSCFLFSYSARLHYLCLRTNN